VRLRAGLHAGDVDETDGDVFGDAVNLAARLQAAAPPGGALVSRLAADLAGGGAGASLRPEGALRLKGAPRPVEALSLDLSPAPPAAARAEAARTQDVRFARSADGVTLAWTATGDGPPLVKAPNWIQHLELDWETLNVGWLAALSARRRLVRFDSRGNGLSDWDAPEISLERFVDDLEAIFDAAGLDRAPVIGFSQGAAAGAAFAARRPDRVSALVCIGGFAQGINRRADPKSAELAAASVAFARADWHGAPPSVRDHFARLLAPDASSADQAAYAEAMEHTISPDNFARFREAVGAIDVTGLLPQVRCPALVLHGREDRIHPVSQGRRLASGIPGARFVAFDTRNHMTPDYDPAFPVMLREVEAFLAAHA
jgi:pimeloyl-ACP methyl ester carboxylesterase